MSWIRNNNKILVAVGVFLVCAGIGVILITQSEIDGLEEALTNETLTPEEIWRFEGALQWWRTTYFDITIPVSTILTLSGIALALSSVLASVLKDMDY
ncbi:MAG: hypothetical protein NWF03_05385 [Candidatus Bathyarchaeota archaeon]|nr:hypothetical protein [Candidatus Bathyarchaeota archaeon]